MQSLEDEVLSFQKDQSFKKSANSISQLEDLDNDELKPMLNHSSIEDFQINGNIEQVEANDLIRDDSDDEEDHQDPETEIRVSPKNKHTSTPAQPPITDDFIMRSATMEKSSMDTTQTNPNPGYMSENEKYRNELLKKALQEKKATIVIFI